jgi:hypothetical protein
MSNMKDYAMWLDDQGIAKWDTGIGELIVPEGVNVFTEELLEQYNTDAEWNGYPSITPPYDPEDNEVIIEDDDEDDGFLDDDELGDSWQLPEHLPTETATDYHLDLIGELL